MMTDETPEDIRALALAHGEDAIAVLAEIMNDAKAPASIRVSAAKAILERGFGKPGKEPPPDDGNRAEPVIRFQRVLVYPDGSEEEYGSENSQVEEVQESRAA